MEGGAAGTEVAPLASAARTAPPSLAVAAGPPCPAIQRLLDTTAWTFVIVFCTLWALYSTDLTVLWLDKDSDVSVAIVSICVTAIFAAEITLNFALKRDYGAEPGWAKLNMFFWVDLFGTASLIPEIMMLLGSDLGSPKAAAIARAGRAARIGARFARVVRFIRGKHVVCDDKGCCCRFEQFKPGSSSSSLGSSDGAATAAKPAAPGADADAATVDAEATGKAQRKIVAARSNLGVAESRTVGWQVSESINRRVVFLTLLVIVVTPPLTYFEPAEQESFGLDTLEWVWERHTAAGAGGAVGSPHNSSQWQAALRALQRRAKEEGGHIIRLDLRYPVKTNLSPPQLIACGSFGGTGTKVSFYCDDAAMGCTAGKYAEAPCHDMEGYRDQKKLRVVEVVEKESESESSKMWLDVTERYSDEAQWNLILISFCVVIFTVGAVVFNTDVHKLVVDPVERMTSLVKKMSQKINFLARNGDETDGDNQYLQTAIFKMGGLLQMVFGNAGADVIARNMTSGDAKLNPMQAGKRVECIFGFCDIREFTATTEELKEDVMMFVNLCGEHIHYTAREHKGFPNKNVGDAFLMVWKPPLQNEDDGLAGPELWDEVNESEDDSSLCIADHAYLTVIESVTKINACGRLKRLTEESKHAPSLQKRFPLYRTRLGFGLHMGWAIEGTIGSRVKVDCSYLGPHVNMAERLETATKVYGVGLLLSEDFVALMSEERKRFIRKVDRIMMRGLYKEGPKPMWLWGEGIGQDDNDYRIRKINKYMVSFEDGIDAYVLGDWKLARTLLEQCQRQQPDDKPSGVILNFMAETNYVKPTGWKGYREGNGLV